MEEMVVEEEEAWERGRRVWASLGVMPVAVRLP